jgi:protein phosphatase
MKKIPLGPTLVLLIGPSGSGKTTLAKRFIREEIVSSDDIRQEYTGDFRRQDMNNIVFNEMDKRIATRLDLGLRVVVDATNVRDSSRKNLVKLAQKYGAFIVYLVVNRSLMAKLGTGGWRNDVKIKGKFLIEDHEETFLANEKKILAGDNLADLVIDTRKEDFTIVAPLMRQGEKVFADILDRGYKGILVVSDVHGNLDGLHKMNNLAEDLNFFTVYLGDIVDYGVDTLRASNYVARKIMFGEALSIFGNHERKILRWITQNRTEGIFKSMGFTGTLSTGNEITVNQIKSMRETDRYMWETYFIGMCATMPHFLQMDRLLLTHGACTNSMWGRDEFRFNPNTNEENYALFGETDGTIVNGFPNRLYNWVDDIPARHTVIVGHDIRSDISPFIHTGEQGGVAIFLDTGSSKPERYPNAHLSAVSYEISHNKKKKIYSLENEQFHSELNL